MILVLMMNVAFSQESFNQELYRLYISNRMIEWETPMQRIEKQLQLSPDRDLMFDLLLAEYGFIGYCFSQDRNDKAAEWVDDADALADKLISVDPSRAAVYAIKAAIYGFRITLRPAKAIFYGPKNQRNIDRAIELDPNEPLGWFVYGNSEFFRPAAFGGSKTTGIEYYRKAIGLVAKNAADTRNNWFYINMLIMLADAYERTSQPALARETYEKILRVEPRFTALEEKVR
jgi:tetratricopeptide (TPR) repeat protein